jgi:hypothetical protein
VNLPIFSFDQGGLHMTYQPEDLQKYGKEQLDTLSNSSSFVTKSWKLLADESAEYSKKSLENGSVFLEKLLGVKTIDGAIKIQLEYAKSLYDDHVAYVSKITELYSNIAKEALAPVGNAISKAQSFKE